MMAQVGAWLGGGCQCMRVSVEGWGTCVCEGHTVRGSCCGGMRTSTRAARHSRLIRFLRACTRAREPAAACLRSRLMCGTHCRPGPFPHTPRHHHTTLQAISLAKRPHIVVGTPGRVVDHLSNTKGFSLKGLKHLVGLSGCGTWTCRRPRPCARLAHRRQQQRASRQHRASRYDLVLSRAVIAPHCRRCWTRPTGCSTWTLSRRLTRS